jgi:hypothetical protein
MNEKLRKKVSPPFEANLSSHLVDREFFLSFTYSPPTPLYFVKRGDLLPQFGYSEKKYCVFLLKHYSLDRSEHLDFGIVKKRARSLEVR